ncbi:hypothetical protein HanIR_Chr09g0409731 [Helianthus annuus]|nr:hypothetical protein HanIR_Chr09g0409731 [Helianthus annuus]
MMDSPYHIFVIFGALCSMLTSSIAVDTLSPNQLIRDGDTIFSSGGMFELGIFLARVTPTTDIWEYGTKTFQMAPLSGLPIEIPRLTLLRAS